MKHLAIITALFVGIASPALADQMHLLDSMPGIWAIDGECGVKSKTYVATVYDNGASLVWEDGLGNVDKEAVIGVGESEFRTITVGSVHGHGGGHRLGTGWTYSAFGSFGSLQITRSGKTFYASRCSADVTSLYGTTEHEFFESSDRYAHPRSTDDYWNAEDKGGFCRQAGHVPECMAAYKRLFDR